ncbi:MAG: glycosyltransferase [Halioglobus sp.]
MKRILAFSFFPAFTPVSNGGESRLFNFYQALSKKHHVTLLSSGRPGNAEESVLHGANFIERRIPKDEFFAQEYQRLLPYSSGGDISAIAIAASGDLPTLLHNAYLEEYENADVVIHESPFTIGYDLFVGIDDKPRIYNSYNCEAKLYKELHPDEKSKPIWDIVRDCEIKALQYADITLYCNRQDIEEFEVLAPNASYEAIYTPHGVTPTAVNTRTSDRSDAIRSIVFMGSGHPPNQDAAQFIAKKLAPTFPLITFHIIGGCLNKGTYSNNVIRHGFIDESAKVELIVQADLALNPMRMGSGANVKAFELLGTGVPLLSTEFGIRGIEGLDQNYCVLAEMEDFESTIRQWSDRNHELQEVGLRGREYVTENFSWERTAEPLCERLAQFSTSQESSSQYVVGLNDYDSFDNGGGGGVRTRELYSAVSEWCRVIFLCFSPDDRMRVYDHGRNIRVICIPKSAEHKRAELEAASQHFISIDDIIAGRYCLQHSLLTRIYACVRRSTNAIIVEHCYMSPIPIHHGDRFVYSSQNSETNLKQDVLQGHPYYSELIREIRSLEKSTCQRAAAIIAVSDEDAAIFTRISNTAGPIITIPNGASPLSKLNENLFRELGQRVDKDSSVLFIGSAHPPNIEALKFVTEELAPSLPKIQFHVLGSVCSTVVNAPKNVVTWGVVSEDEKAAIMQSARLAINPVISGGGSNIKTADYLANGLFTLTTDFGLRGYPDTTSQFCFVRDRTDFSRVIPEALRKANGIPQDQIKAFFAENLSMSVNAKRLVPVLKRLNEKKKRILVVSYRYTYPALGGAEAYILKLIEALDKTNQFQIDVVATEVSSIVEKNRFASGFVFESETAAPNGLQNVRYARFPVDEYAPGRLNLKSIWRAQPAFERQHFYALLEKCKQNALAWGWSSPEGNEKIGRWAYSSCGIYVSGAANIEISGFCLEPVSLSATDGSGNKLFEEELDGKFGFAFASERGVIDFFSSAIEHKTEMRPISFFVSCLKINGADFPLSNPTVIESPPGSSKDTIEALAEAADATRRPLAVNLTECRGPLSNGLESYLEGNIGKYDLVVTHNNIFHTATIAVNTANKHGVPVISIPHAHLDDDFYHFPDVEDSIRNSDLALVCPKLACDYYQSRGANANYHSPGIDTSEGFLENDSKALRSVFDTETEFFLVLGRKTHAKGYRRVISAIEELATSRKIHLLIIGPDDDGISIASPHVTYLGLQPREVVRGALMSCVALINMSASESFGMVLLEAWMAKKPVVVNAHCAAFLDIAVHNENAILVEDDPALLDALVALCERPELRASLGESGYELVPSYDWGEIGQSFVNECLTLIK